MRVLRLSMQFAAFIMLFIFLACTSTKSDITWKDETYKEHPKKILVINAFQNPSIRRLFEDEMVKALRDRRVDVVVQYTVMPDVFVYDKEAVAAQAKEVGADTVLITRPVGTRMGASGASGGLYINTQTDVYDMRSNGLILSVTAETQMRQGAADLQHYLTQVPAFVKDLVNKLSQAGLF